ncbi:hypothetical protein BJ912DRAFT_939270, partial [Pholiota molesta]
ILPYFLIIVVTFVASASCIPTESKFWSGQWVDLTHRAAGISSFTFGRRQDDFTVRTTVTLAPAFGLPVIFQGVGVDNSMTIVDKDGNPTNATCFTSPAQDFNHTIFLFFEFSVDGQQPFETSFLRPPSGQHVLRFEAEAAADNEDNEIQFFVTLLPGPPGC